MKIDANQEVEILYECVANLGYAKNSLAEFPNLPRARRERMMSVLDVSRNALWDVINGALERRNESTS